MEYISSFQRTIDSVRLPLEHFIKTGFWDPYILLGYTASDISDVQVRKACRLAAQEVKRPFVQCYAVFQRGEWQNQGSQNGYKWVDYPEPKWVNGFVEMPKRRYLSPLVAPLLLAAPDETTFYSRYGKPPAQVVRNQSRTLWSFRVFDRALWDEYYAFVLNDPDCRKARRLPITA